MENANSGRESVRLWSAADDARLRKLVADMWPIPKIFAEFPQHDANAVRDALELLFAPASTPTERALQVLGGRGRRSRRSAPGFTLDGRPASARELVSSANVILRAYGEPAIAYPGVR